LTLAKYTIDTLFPGIEKEKDKSQLSTRVPPALKTIASRVLFKLSVLSFDVVFSRVEDFFKNMKTDEVNISYYNIIEYLSFDRDKLSRLIVLLDGASAKFKKHASNAIAQPLRKAIWNYIVNFPHQFISDCRKMTGAGGNPINLFHMFNEKTKKSQSVWPVQTMVLLLCPKVLSDVIMLIKSGKSDSNYTKEKKFLETLKASLKTKDKADSAVACYVDLYKASSYLSKSDMGALRFWISEVQSVMLDRLDNPVKTPDGKPDVSLMVDFIVSAYRVNPRNAVACILPNFIKGSGICRLALAKAIFIIAQEQAPLPWHPTLAESYAHIAKSIRLLFQDALQEDRNYYQQKMNLIREQQALTSTKSKKKLELEPNYASETLLNLIVAFYLEPLLPLENTAGSDKLHLTDVLYFFHGLTNCLGEKNSPQVQHHAHRLLRRFFDVGYIYRWVPGDVMTGFTEISASVMTQLSTTLLEDKDIQGEHIKPILELVKEITTSSNLFITHNREDITEEHLNSRKRIQSWESIESALLVLLCSTDSEIWISAASCFGDLCDQIEILGQKELKSNTILSNYNLYRQIARIVTNGKKSDSQQKIITRLLRRVEVQTKANIAAFIEVYNRWRKYTESIIKGEMRARENREDTSINMSKMKAMWKNYTTFLCSIGGVCLQTGDGILVTRGSGKNNMTEDLIKELMKLLTLDHKYISDNVTRIVGVDLSPGVYGVLFQNLHKSVAEFFGEDNTVKVSNVSTMFVDKAINIVKSIIEQAEENSEDLSLANFETLILSFIRYCAHLVSADAVGIKCKVCLLIVTMMSKREYITFGNEVQFRFNALKNIAEWTSDFASSVDDKATKINDSELDDLCMRAIAVLLKNLSLAKIKRDKVSAQERDELNKREFVKYFHFLSKYLAKMSKQTVTSSSANIREHTIVGLGNLLESNINYGLEQFMKMTYLEDQSMRSAFLAVLTKIVKQGIQLDAADSVEPQEKYERLLNILAEDKLPLVFLMLQSVSMTEQDELCRAFVRLFAERGEVLKLLKAAIEIEVEQTLFASTLFRANSSASKMLSAFCALYGKKYMSDVLSSLIIEVTGDSSGRYEVDPSKLKDDENSELNMKRLTVMAQKFVDAILRSVDDCPMQIRSICDYLGKSVEEKFPQNDPQEEFESTDGSHKPKYVAIGGLLVLRFLNPAVASPKTNGLVEAMPSTFASRHLIIVSKVLQNVFNGVKFKEDYMKPMDSFIKRNLPSVREFYDNIAQYGDYDDDEAMTLDEETKLESLHILHRCLINNLDKMKQKAQDDDKERVERLASLVIELGKPPEKEKATITHAVSTGEFTNVLFQNFMAQMAIKNPNLAYIEEKTLFYKSGVTRDQHPVVYFIPRKFEGIDNDEDNENALYHVLKTLQTIFTKPYCIVVDCTEFKEEDGLQVAHFTKLFKLLPDGAKKNISKVIFFNPNTYLKDFAKPFQNRINRKNGKKVQFVSTLKDLYPFIDEKNCALPDLASNFEDDVQLTVNPAWIVVSHLNLKEAVVKLSNKKLCIITKDDSILGIATKKVDFIDIIKISNVKLVINQNDETLEQVVVEYDTMPPKIIAVKTDNNKQLQMAIKACRVRLLSELSMATMHQMIEYRGVRQEDIPGSVLNMCFLNLESKFPHTRRAAYNLLAALAEQFDFPVKLLETDLMCVPHNTGDLVVTLSEKVAQGKPSLTSQFLTESLRGFNKVSMAYKLLCLKYMKPWIKNLSTEYSKAAENGDDGIVEKIKEWFPDLVKSTMEFPDVYPAMLSELWGEISKDESLVSISMDCILSASLESGIGTAQSDILNDLVVTLASRDCSELVVKTILDQAITTLNEEIFDTDEGTIENNPAWTKVIICCRYLLMLSFQNRVDVVNNVPTVFYIINLLVGRGSLFLRSTLHALAVNVVHSLGTALEFSREQSKLIQAHLSTLCSDKFRLIFIGNLVDKPDPFISPANKGTSKTEPVPVTMSDIETLTGFLVEVMRTCTLVYPGIQRDWEYKLSNLYKPGSAVFNFWTLPRLLTSYGVLIKSGEESQEALPFILDCLFDSFRNYTAGKNDFPVSTLLCLSQFCNKLSADDALLSKMLLIPIFLLPNADIALFPVVVKLLDCIITSISSSQLFKECRSIEDYFNRYCRNERTEHIFQKFERAINISFRTHFSYAISCLVIKGLTNTQTRERTVQILLTLVSISSRVTSNMYEILGFATGLLPYNADQLAGIVGDLNQIYSEDTFSHRFSPLMFVRYLLAIVQNVELDSEKIAIYNTLQESFERLPEIFEPVYPEVLPRVTQVYTVAANQNINNIAEATLSLLNRIMICPDAHEITTTEDPLNTISFGGINRLGSFKTLNEQVTTECHGIMIEYVKAFFPNIGDNKEIRKRSAKKVVVHQQLKSSYSSKNYYDE
jgi:hypothetical protein